MPTVSVIIPFFNSGDYLSEAVESVRAQTFKDWELILVNDGSTDRSLDHAIAYAAKDHRIKLVNHFGVRNRGQAASRNSGAKLARGEYIANLDHDDVFEAQKLEIQVDILERSAQTAMTFGPMLIWHSWNSSNDYQDSIQEFTFVTPATFCPPSFIAKLVSGENDPHGYLLRKKAFDAVTGYEENISFCEDWSLYFKVMLKYQVHVSEFPLYRYRKHAGQVTATAISDGTYFGRFSEFFDFAIGYLRDNVVTQTDKELHLEIVKYANFFEKLNTENRRNKESAAFEEKK